MLAYTLHTHTRTVYREHSVTERCSVRGFAFQRLFLLRRRVAVCTFIQIYFKKVAKMEH